MTRREFGGRVGLLAGSVLMSLLVLELGCRLVFGFPDDLIAWRNLARLRVGNENAARACAYTFDAVVGWTLPTACSLPTYHLDADDFRVTSTTPLPSGQAPLLVTGSSFALGEEVKDTESWPAYLQRLTGRRVLNGGVSGYSLDQSVLRAEVLAPRFLPLAIVVSFTPDDVRRTELAMAWSREKPWFDISDGRLQLRGVPVPEPGTMPLPTVSRLLGWSRLADVIARHTGAAAGWYYEERYGAAAGSGAAISCLLMNRLATLGVPVMVVAEYSRGHWLADAAGKARDRAITQGVLDCAARQGLVPFDTAGPFASVVAVQGLDTLFGAQHHSPTGNRATADMLMQELVRHHLLRATADN